MSIFQVIIFLRHAGPVKPEQVPSVDIGIQIDKGSNTLVTPCTFDPDRTRLAKRLEVDNGFGNFGWTVLALRARFFSSVLSSGRRCPLAEGEYHRNG
jgi:hypothetical protein